MITFRFAMELSRRVREAYGLDVYFWRRPQDMSMGATLKEPNGNTLISKEFDWFDATDDVVNWVTLQCEQYASWK